MFDKICQNLNLGNLTNVVEVNGGLTNKIYKMVTDKGIFAIKIINEGNIKHNSNLLKKIEYSEIIANEALKNGVNAVCAIKFNNKYIQKYEDQYILIYHWCNGKVLLTKELTLEHVKKAAQQLAILHRIKVQQNQKLNKYPKINFRKYYDLLKDNDEDWSKSFRDNIDYLCNLYDIVYDNYIKLSNHIAYVHKDLNRKNILWHNEEINIIDWETANIDNPIIDFFNSAWFLTDDVLPDKYYTFAQAYLEITSFNDDINCAAYASIIEECNWLEFSLKRALKIHSQSTYEIKLGMNSISSSLKEIINYYETVPKMLQIIKQVLSE